MHKIQMKRIYESTSKNDGSRILVDRLWPRGVSKEEAKLDLWPKEITPSDDLRKEYHQEKIEFDRFYDKYLEELKENNKTESFIEEVKEKLADKNVTLLTAAKDIEQSHVVVLRDYLKKKLKKE